MSEEEQEEVAEEDEDEQQSEIPSLSPLDASSISSGVAGAQGGAGTTQLLSSSVLPQSEAHSSGRRRCSSTRLSRGDPVCKRLKF